ncbi:hypothetical protein NU965_19140, partial [Stenotrophomonas indicatrix]|nr:hypothetical protein [Stenotrophomonas indicatrix]
MKIRPLTTTLLAASLLLALAACKGPEAEQAKQDAAQAADSAAVAALHAQVAPCAPALAQLQLGTGLHFVAVARNIRAQPVTVEL